MISSGRPPRRTRFCTVRSATPNRAAICSVVAPSRASLLNATTWSAGCMEMRTTFSASDDSAAASGSTTRHGTGWFFGMCLSAARAFSARSLRAPAATP